MEGYFESKVQSANAKLEARGKPSTWLPRGRLLEQIQRSKKYRKLSQQSTLTVDLCGTLRPILVLVPVPVPVSVSVSVSVLYLYL